MINCIIKKVFLTIKFLGDNFDELLACMPSNNDPLRSFDTASRRSLRRTTSVKKELLIDRQESQGNVLIASQVVDIIDGQDVIDGNKTIKLLAAPMAQRKSIR